MPKRDTLSTALTLIKRGDQWIIQVSDWTEQGPYLSAIVALQVAALEVWSARKRGLEAELFVQDDHSVTRLCRLIEKSDGTQRCAACQSFWRASHPVQPRCPLWEALGAQ